MSRAPLLPLVLVLALATGAVALAAGAVVGSAPSPAASGSASGDLVGRFYAALNEAIRTGGVAPLDALLAPDFVDHPAPIDDTSPRAALLHAVLALHAASPDLRLEVETVAAEGDTVTVRSHLRPGETGDAQVKAAAGPTAVARRIDVFRVEGGVIAEHWGIGDGDARCGAPIDQGGGLSAARGRSFGTALSLDGAVWNGAGQAPTPRWQIHGAAVSADLVVADGAIYAVGWDSTLLALDAATGTERWRFTTDDQVYAPPVVGDDAVYAVTASGVVHAIDIATGRARWRARAAGIVGRGLSLADGTIFLATGTAPAPAVVDGVVYAVRSEVGSAVQAFDAGTGTERWRFYLTDQALYSIETATLHTRWQLPLHGETVSAPMVADGAVYVAADGLYGVDAATGRVRWRIDGAADLRSFQAIGEGLVYLADADGRLRAIEGETGVERWVVDTGGVVVSAPLVAGGVVYLGSRDGHLHAVDAPSGITCGRFALGAITLTPAVADGIAYVGTLDGRLVAVSVDALL